MDQQSTRTSCVYPSYCRTHPAPIDDRHPPANLLRVHHVQTAVVRHRVYHLCPARGVTISRKRRHGVKRQGGAGSTLRCREPSQSS
eukprot:9305-Eustigmatos_ZCMA.PRE.1